MNASTRKDMDMIAGAVEAYVAACRAGDPDLMRAAFHPMAHMYGQIDGRDIATPIESFFEHVSRSGPITDPAYTAMPGAIDICGSAAIAVLEETAYQGRDFRDTFSLVRLDGRWRIVAKLFAVRS